MGFIFTKDKKYTLVRSSSCTIHHLSVRLSSLNHMLNWFLGCHFLLNLLYHSRISDLNTIVWVTDIGLTISLLEVVGMALLVSVVIPAAKSAAGDDRAMTPDTVAVIIFFIQGKLIN